MGLVQGKGEEEEMKDYMKQASQGLILTSASMHGPSSGGGSRGVGGFRGGMSHSKSDVDLQRQRSLGGGGRSVVLTSRGIPQPGDQLMKGPRQQRR